jgi:hypothetical protein
MRRGSIDWFDDYQKLDTGCLAMMTPTIEETKGS